MRKPTKRSSFAAVLLAALLLASSSCSEQGKTDLSNTTGETTGFQEATMETSGVTSEPTGETTTTEGTLSDGSQEADVTVRVEGASETRFSGLCTVGAKDTVIAGKVPKQFNYNLDNKSISCRIQKQDSGAGSLRVILLAGNTTRSVQQTNAEHGTINVSYSGGS